MADSRVFSSGANLEGKSSTESARFADNQSYVNGVLAWGGGQLKDEDIITVTRTSEDDAFEGFTITTLETADLSQPATAAPFKLITTSASTLPKPFLDKHLFHTSPAHLDHETNVLYVFISTLSGTGLAPQFFKDVLEPLLRVIGLSKSDYGVVRTQNADSVKAFARSGLLPQANKGKKQTVLMLSGDGGIIDTINGLLEGGVRSSAYTKPVLSQIPLGTGNALFHSLHKPSNLPSVYIQGLRTLLCGTSRPLPIFRTTFSPGARALTNEARTQSALHNNTLYGAVVASYGLHATLVADSDTTEYRKHGDKRFGLVANDLLNPPEGGSPHAYKAKVTLKKEGGKEDVITREEHGYVLASLVSNLEKAFTISPASKPLDGQLWVVHFGPLDGETTMEVMKEAYNNGNHVALETVGYESIKGLKISFLEEGADWKWRRCCIDGLIVGVENGGWMELHQVEGGSEAVDIVIDG